MNVRGAIDKILREQADKTNLIEALWCFYATSVKIPTGGVQWIESRRCFFAGAMTLFEAVTIMANCNMEPTDADLARMNAIEEEFKRFIRDLVEGRG